MFDGWSERDTHYIGMFAVYPAKGSLGYKRALLSFSPLLNEHHLDAEEHVQFITTVLSWFEKDC